MPFNEHPSKVLETRKKKEKNRSKIQIKIELHIFSTCLPKKNILRNNLILQKCHVCLQGVCVCGKGKTIYNEKS